MCSCPKFERVAGGAIFLPCQCEEAEVKKKALQKRRKVMLEVLEKRLEVLDRGNTQTFASG